MGVVDAVWEVFRDHARDNICAGLQSLGMDAQMADRGRPEEDSGGGSLGIIDIVDGPISWVNVRKVNSGSQDDASVDRYTDYGVKVSYRLPNATISLVSRKNFPLLGEVDEADWRAEGSDTESGLVAGVLRRLWEDVQVRRAIIATRDVEITRSWLGCWVVSTDTNEAPTRRAWDCYQAIARHLIQAGRVDEAS